MVEILESYCCWHDRDTEQVLFLYGGDTKQVLVYLYGRCTEEYCFFHMEEIVFGFFTW